MGFLLLHTGRRPTHFARCCQDCMSGTNLRLACALRIAGFNVGWALQECTPACCFARLCTSALSNTHFCRVPDSCPTPQARLPRLTGPCKPLFAKCSCIYGKVAGLPDFQPCFGIMDTRCVPVSIARNSLIAVQIFALGITAVAVMLRTISSGLHTNCADAQVLQSYCMICNLSPLRRRVALIPL